MRLLKIGHDPHNDIVLNSNKVSSLHAELTLLDNGDIMLEDKGSLNGTYIMNKPIQPNKPVTVRRGDTIRFADVELQWSQVPMPEDNSAYKALFGIGTHFNNDIQISGATVSRYHATVKQGRDGKMWIVDHSKNGTTVNGQKIQPNQPVRIKRKSAVVCGGVPVDLSRLPWPSETWKYVLGAVACVLVVFGVGFGVVKLWPGSDGHKFTDTELYNRYNRSIVMFKMIYHYKISIGDMSDESVEHVINRANEVLVPNGYDKIPVKFLILPTKNGPRPFDLYNLSDKEIVSFIDRVSADRGLGAASGFFVSDDGKVLTNLHVAKPWLDEKDASVALEGYYRQLFAMASTVMPNYNAFLSEIKVVGVLDNIALVPQGEIFDPENVRKCRVLEAGDDLKKDVALLQLVNGELPRGCTYVNIKDSMDTSDEDLIVGSKVITFGFPHAHGLQESGEELKVYANPGTISREPSDYDFMLNLTSAGGASGSPIFNEYGMLIGVLNSGVSGENFTGAIKTKYVKQLLENSDKNL